MATSSSVFAESARDGTLSTVRLGLSLVGLFLLGLSLANVDRVCMEAGG